MNDKPHPAESRDWMRNSLGRARRLAFHPSRLARHSIATQISTNLSRRDCSERSLADLVEVTRAIAADCEAEFWPDDSFWCPDDVRTEWLVDDRDEAPTKGFTPAADPNDVISTYCRQLWTTVVVSANADVYPCCLLYEPEHAVGNLLEEDIWSIRNNDRMAHLRRYVSDREADDPPFPNLSVKCTSRWCTVVVTQRPVQLGAPAASA